jgi:RNA polymerase sigma-70 factor (ECF subfamily)
VNTFSFRQSFTEGRSSASLRGAVMNSVRLADDGACFQKIVLPHLDDAYALARWLVGNRTDAEDVAQRAYLRAFREIDSRRHSNARVWVLAIVRRAACEWLQENRAAALVAIEQAEGSESPETAVPMTDATQIEAAIAVLPALFRETIVLRDILGLSYREIAELTGVPTAAVAWRLAEARRKLLMTVATVAPDRGGRSSGAM